jgi:hypothetical protein
VRKHGGNADESEAIMRDGQIGGAERVRRAQSPVPPDRHSGRWAFVSSELSTARLIEWQLRSRQVHNTL